MTSKAGIFFAGVGTTFIILGAGFGGGLFMANSALKDSAGAPARVSSPAPAEPARVILPSTAEAAQPPQPATQREPATPDAASPPEPVKDVQAPVEKQADVVDTRKSDIAEMERRKRYAERKAKRVATEQAKRQQRRIEQGEQRREAPVLLEQARRREVPIMASEDDDSPPRPLVNFFGND